MLPTTYDASQGVHMAHYFGTDGIRGVAGKDLTAEFALKLGRAAGELIREKGWEKKVVIGRDSRISGPMLESALTAGLMSVGIDVHVAGITPTPVIAFLARHYEFPLGCVISASHNPIEDNGIKFFDIRGMKLEEELETRIEELIESDPVETREFIGADIGILHDASSRVNEYVRHMVDIGQDKLRGMKIVVDAAYGAAAMLSPSVFTLLEAQIIPMNCIADGSQINVNCGATNVEACREMVARTGADFGVALDGDADRAILVDENGNVVDGDQVLAMWGLHLLDRGELKNDSVVGTVLSNQGLEVALNGGGGKLLRAPVGDKYVMREMLASGAKIGGEQSGHLIFLDHHTTGDGILTAVMTGLLMKETSRTLSDLALQMTRYPQVQLNINVRNKKAALEDDGIKSGIEELSNAMTKSSGRLLVRPSGTESVIRVMTEAPDETEARKVAEMAIDLFRQFSENGIVTEL